MNKQKFIQILQNYSNITEEDRNRLHELAIEYPYCQVIHTLVAKANKDGNTDLADKTLAFAAMYAADRSVLKKIIQQTRHQQPIEPEENVIHPSPVIPSSETPPADDLRKEIWIDLAELQKSKAAYLQWADQDENNHADPELQEIRKADHKDKKIKKPGSSKSLKKVKDKADSISRSKPKSWDIIDDFISKEPSITTPPVNIEDNQPDLSASSTSFNDDLVSENLAQIFINQQKKDKAIDIYKKLIWKFPQKKAYFASRIEELQK